LAKSTSYEAPQHEPGIRTYLEKSIDETGSIETSVSRLMLSGERDSVYYENHTKHANKLRGQIQFFIMWKQVVHVVTTSIEKGSALFLSNGEISAPKSREDLCKAVLRRNILINNLI
jgi:hypothetical protein